MSDVFRLSGVLDAESFVPLRIWLQVPDGAPWLIACSLLRDQLLHTSCYRGIRLWFLAYVANYRAVLYQHGSAGLWLSLPKSDGLLTSCNTEWS